MKVYGIKNCGSVKKAISLLNENNKQYEFIDLKKDTVDTDTIKQWLQKTTIQKLLNTKGTTYKTLSLKDKTLSDNEKIEWLAKENMLIKRPVIITDNEQIIVGFDEELIKKI